MADHGEAPGGRSAPGTVYGDAVSQNPERTARPARRRLAPDERRQALINAALELFNAREYDEVSVDDIAAAAGMSRPLVYHYYGGKAGMFIAAMRQAGDDLVQAVMEAGSRDPADWLAGGLAAYLDYVQSNPIGLAALLRHGSLPGRADRQVRDEIRDQVLTLILIRLDPPTDSPVLRAVLRGWIAMVETMAREWLIQGEPTRAEFELLLPELLRAVLGAAAWHDTAVAAVLPHLPR
jgi:AcrR family transcriptional regulator